MSTTYQILLAAVITEGLLVIVSYIFGFLFELSIVWRVSWQMCAIGVVATIPLLLLNNLLWRWSASHPRSVFSRFSRDVVIPLCRQVPPPLAAALAIMSGFGEELFFRGVFNSLAGEQLGRVAAALITSVVFAYVHFVGLLKVYGGMLPLYTLVGLYFWSLHLWTSSLFAAIVTHATYNFCAIVLARRSASARRTPLEVL